MMFSSKSLFPLIQNNSEWNVENEMETETVLNRSILLYKKAVIPH